MRRKRTRKQRAGVLPPLTFLQEGLLHPFFFMGCWNKTYSDERGSLRRDAVLNAIQADDRAPLLVIAGDNAYPDKRKVKQKNGSTIKDPVFVSTQIQSGFTKLLATKPNIWLGIGNHNVDNHIPFNNGKSNTIRKREQNAFGSRLPHDFYCLVHADAALVFVDTNLIGQKEFTKDHPMMSWFTKVIQWLHEFNKPYYIVQHEPIIALKVKKGVLKPFALTNGQLLLDEVAEIGQYPIAIVSADIHNYQELDLTYKGHVYRQVVVGTGGAPPDVIPKERMEQFRQEDGNYRVAAADLEALGFESILYMNNAYLDTPDYGYLRLNSSEEREFIGIGQSEQFLEDGK